MNDPAPTSSAPFAPGSTERTPPVSAARPTRSPSGPPGAFARVFLEGLSKYRARTHDVGTPTEEAAANLAERAAPARALHGLDLRSPRAIVETLAVTVGVPLVGYAIDRSDPLFLRDRFSWLVLAPVLVALRHGLTMGLTSAVVLDVALVGAWRTHLLGLDRFPSAAFVGLIAVAMLVGQFSDVWKREIVRLDAGFRVLRNQNNELSRSHFLLELSHDRLGAQLGRDESSLREAIAAVRELARGAPDTSYSSLGDAMMEVLGAYCMLEVGELYLVERRELGPLVAVLGRPQPLDPESPMVREALRTGRLTYVPAASRSRRDGELEKSPLLAAIPFVDTMGHVSAVLCVHAMPFISFEKRNLEAMATLAGHFADLVVHRGEPSAAQRGRREIFEVELNRALRDLRDHQVPSVVVFLWIRRGASMADLVDPMLGGPLRDLDFPYVARDPSGHSFVYVVLPAADASDARALEERLESAAKRTRNASLAQRGVSFSFHTLQPTDSMLDIFRLFSKKAQQNVVEHEHAHLP